MCREVFPSLSVSETIHHVIYTWYWVLYELADFDRTVTNAMYEDTRLSFQTQTIIINLYNYFVLLKNLSGDLDTKRLARSFTLNLPGNLCLFQLWKCKNANSAKRMLSTIYGLLL